VKNSVIFLGLASTAHAVDASFWRSTVLAAVAFCALSSAGYALNDVLDVELDRAHRIKRSRPVAAGLITVPCAAGLSIVLSAAGLATASPLGSAFFLRAAAYLAVSVGYSAWLKRVPYVEIASIAAAFLLRLDAGAVLGEGRRAPLLYGAIASAAAFLAISKRLQELSRGTAPTRHVLKRYSPRGLRTWMLILGYAALASFAAYGLSAKPETILAAQMSFTLPLVVVGFLRYLFLMLRRTEADDPTLLLIHDRTLRYVFVLWVGAVVLSLAMPSLSSIAHGGRQR